jgi:hypothetical protein
MHRPTHHSLARTGALLAVALFLVACGSEGDDGGAIAGGGPGATSSTVETTVVTTTTTVPATTTTAAPTPEEEALAAYQNYWRAVDEAFSPPRAQPDLPALRQFATGEVLDIVGQVELAVSEDFVFRIPDGGQYVHRAEVLAVDGDTATIRDCTIDDTVKEVASTGEVLDDAVSTRLYIAMMVREGGQWKLGVLNQETTWEGVDGCALES